MSQFNHEELLGSRASRNFRQGGEVSKPAVANVSFISLDTNQKDLIVKHLRKTGELCDVPKTPENVCAVMDYYARKINYGKTDYTVKADNDKIVVNGRLVSKKKYEKYLKEEQRALRVQKVKELRYNYNYPLQKIADTLGISRDTVSKDLQR